MRRENTSAPGAQPTARSEVADRELYEAAELLGAFPDEISVEYAHAAQAEVALKVEYSAPEFRSPHP